MYFGGLQGRRARKFCFQRRKQRSFDVSQSFVAFRGKLCFVGRLQKTPLERRKNNDDDWWLWWRDGGNVFVSCFLLHLLYLLCAGFAICHSVRCRVKSARTFCDDDLCCFADLLTTTTSIDFIWIRSNTFYNSSTISNPLSSLYTAWWQQIILRVKVCVFGFSLHRLSFIVHPSTFIQGVPPLRYSTIPGYYFVSFLPSHLEWKALILVTTWRMNHHHRQQW